MSRRDRLTQTRGLILIQSDGGLTCEKSPNLVLFPHYPARSPSRSTEDRWREPKLFVSAILTSFLFFFFFGLFVWKPIASHRKRGFNLPLVKYDECYYAQGWMKTSVILLSKHRSRKVQFMTSITSSVRSRKYAMLSISPLPICNEFQAATCLRCRHFCNGLSSSRIPASPRRLWFQELNYSATFVDVVLQVNAAELCSSWNCSSSLISGGRSPPPNVIGCRLQNVIIIYTRGTCVRTKKGTMLPLSVGGTGIFNISLRKCYFHIY